MQIQSKLALFLLETTLNCTGVSEKVPSAYFTKARTIPIQNFNFLV